MRGRAGHIDSGIGRHIDRSHLRVFPDRQLRLRSRFCYDRVSDAAGLHRHIRSRSAHRQLRDAGIAQHHFVGALHGNILERSFQNDRVLTVVNIDHIDSGPLRGQDAKIAGRRLCYNNTANIAVIDDAQRVFAAASDQNAAAHRHMVKRHGPAADAVANNQISGYGRVLYRHFRNIDHNISGLVTGVSAGSIHVFLKNVIDDLRHLLAGQAILRPNRIVGVAGNVTGPQHGGNRALCVIRDLIAVLIIIQVRGIRRIELQSAGQNSHDLLPLDVAVGIQHIAIPLKGAHADGLCQIRREPVACLYILKGRNIRLFLSAKDPVDDRGHLRAGQSSVWI